MAAEQQIAHEYLSLPKQLVHQFDPGVGVQRHGNGLFAAIIDVELKVIALKGGIIDFRRARGIPHGVAANGFNLYDVGAEIGEHGACTRCGHPRVDFNNGHVVQRRRSRRANRRRWGH